MSATRRNGSLSSCEPCRKSKLRCDHSTPICTRCVRRGRSDSCVYHPAPLSKPREPAKTVKRKADSKSPQSAPPITPCPEGSSVTCSSPAHHSLGSGRITNYGKRPFSHPGFLGITSYTNVFSGDAALEPLTRQDSPAHAPESHVVPTAAPVDSIQIDLGGQVLSLLEHLPFYESLLERRWSLSEGWILGPPLLREFMKALKALYHNATHGPGDKATKVLELSKSISENTARPIEVFSAMKFPEYASIVARRWETISLFFATIGSAIYFVPQNDPVFEGMASQHGKNKDGLRKTTIAASDLCLQFCDSLGTITDPLCWALIHHTVLLSHTYGATDYRTWQKLGDLTTIVFALGLHQPHDTEETPFFLSEIRKRAMIGVYTLDKEIGSFLGRPPRVCRRYCDMQLSLDLSDEELLADAVTREAAIKKLDPDGWNVAEKLQSGTKARLALMFATLWEKALELSLSLVVDDLEDKTEALAHESQTLRLNLPKFLQWTSTHDNFSFAFVHLTLLSLELIPCKVLLKHTGKRSERLISIACEIITALLETVSRQIRSGTMVPAVTSDMCYIGLPAAGVLSSELLRRPQLQPHQLLSEMPFPRSEVIQKLSVFAAHLGTFLWQHDPDYEICKKGQMAISEVLDRVLSDPPAPESLESAIQAANDDVDYMSFWNNFDWEQDMRLMFN